MLAKETGAPIQLELSRKEDFIGVHGRWPTTQYYEVGVSNDDVLQALQLPPAHPGTRSTYNNVLDREAWTHAVVSVAVVLDMEIEICRRARVVLGGVAPIPWRLPNVEQLLAGQRVTPELAAKAGETAIVGAQKLSKNGYKLPMTKALVRRTVLELATRA
jgi:xanthine dehydrogenase YagS FAD-binding subunit